MSSHDIGDAVTLTGTFRNLAGALTNPTGVTLRIRKPDRTHVTVVPTSTATGIWSATVTIDQEGQWRYRWIGTGAIAETEQGSIFVRRRQVW